MLGKRPINFSNVLSSNFVLIVRATGDEAGHCNRGPLRYRNVWILDDL